MIDAALAKKNLELSFEFSRYVLAHPELGDKIPDNAMIVFAVAEDRPLTRYNAALAKRNREAGQPIVTVHIKRLAPSRLIAPRVRLAA